MHFNIILTTQQKIIMKKIILIISIALVSLISNEVLAQWITSGSNIYNSNSGNIGIGKTNPGYKLDVNGNLFTKNYIYVEGSGNEGGKLAIRNSQKTSIGEAIQWEIKNTTGSYHGNSLQFCSYGGGVSENKLTLTDAGNVGIGTMKPQYKLHVDGNLYAKNYIYVEGTGNEGGKLAILNSQKTAVGQASNWEIKNTTGAYHGNSLQFCSYGGGVSENKLTLTDAGNIGIGTMHPTVKLDVIGTIRAEEVKVCLNQGCDFVFEPDYKLMSLNELDNFIQKNKHLPEVAPAAVMESEGIGLSEMNALLLQKIEELTLYVISQDKQIKEQNERIKKLEAN